MINNMPQIFKLRDKLEMRTLILTPTLLILTQGRAKLDYGYPTRIPTKSVCL